MLDTLSNKHLISKFLQTIFFLFSRYLFNPFLVSCCFIVLDKRFLKFLFSRRLFATTSVEDQRNLQKVLRDFLTGSSNFFSVSSRKSFRNFSRSFVSTELCPGILSCTTVGISSPVLLETILAIFQRMLKGFFFLNLVRGILNLL